MSNWRKVWEEHNGPIPKGMHIHHIIPRSEGGTDDIENLQLVTPEEHYDIHFERGDYGACALISDGIDREPVTHPMVQFDLDGHRVKRWNSQSDIGRAGFDARHARECAKYIKKSSDGYQWFYESEVGDIDYIGPVKRKESLVRGHPPIEIKYLDVTDLTIHESQSKATKYARPYLKKNSAGECKWFKNRFIELTKEEYKILKQLENE